MSKISYKPGPMIYPVPAVLVSCGATETDYNIITIAWTGTLCTDPPLCYISVRPDRHSHGLIKKYGGFVINLTTTALIRATDFCGIKSGRDVNKFKAMDLTPLTAEKVKAPLIKESPVNIECSVKEIKKLGTHDMFIAEVLCIHVDEQFQKTGTFRFSEASPLCYVQGRYFSLGELAGKVGFSAQ